MSTLAILGGEPVRRKPFSPWPQYRQSDIDRLTAQVQSRHWGGFPYPTKLATKFCEDFAALQGAKYALPVANGTVAITVALQAAGIGFGDEVIVPAYTWDGTATAALALGAVPVFADIHPDTYCLDVESVRAVITPRTRAIVPVHLAMRFADMDGLRALAAEHNLVIIEDCAHAHGGAWKGQGAGAMGDIGCFSLQESKLTNLAPGDGDRDSVGVLQQRPSQGWGGGDPNRLNDVTEATTEFLDALVTHKNWQHQTLADAIQQVQISADGTAYAKHEPEAQVLADAFQGKKPAAVSCSFDKPTLVATSAKVASQLRAQLPVRKISHTAKVLRVPAQGWQVVAWFVANADRLGVDSVVYSGHEWSRSAGWKVDKAAGADAVVATMATVS